MHSFLTAELLRPLSVPKSGFNEKLHPESMFVPPDNAIWYVIRHDVQGYLVIGSVN